MSICVIYNTCGLGDKENVETYIHNINGLLAQQTKSKYCMALSSCHNSSKTRERLQQEFGQKITHLYIDESQAVQVTFNKACQIMDDKYGPFDVFVYVASDVDVSNNLCLIDSIHNDLSNKNIGSVIVPVDVDHGANYWLHDQGINWPPLSSFQIPLGRTLNLHIQAFHRCWYNKYDKRILPDIFTSYCGESSLSYVAAAICQQIWVGNYPVVKHAVGGDGHTLVFGEGQDKTYPSWFSMENIISFANREEAPFGYQEIFNGGKFGTRLHRIADKSQFDKNGFAKNKKLYHFIKKHLFLSKEILDYDKLKCEIH